MSKISIPCECLGKLNSHRMNGTRYDVKFGYHLSLFFFCFVFLNIQNQSAAGNVIQLIKKNKPGVSQGSTLKALTLNGNWP